MSDNADALIAALDADRIVERIWARDHTVWRNDPAEIADRLGWLDAPASMPPRLQEIQAVADRARDDGITHAVLLGMGGSSLAAETLRTELGGGGMALTVLDSTHPQAVLRVERTHDPRRTLFVVASKSGTTIETLCHLQYFYARIRNGAHFAAITDPGTPLEALARSHDFRGVFVNPPDVGGRFSALTMFGLVPAALMGAGPDALLEGAAAAADDARAPAAQNPAALLGARIAGPALAPSDFVATLALPAGGLGPWVEQLIAESLGKDGRGVLPVPDGSSASPPAPTAADLGAAFFRWMFATAVAGRLLGVHPFDQPDVAEAKAATQAELESGEDPGEFDDAAACLDPPPTSLGICAFVDPSAENAATIEGIRARLTAQLDVPVTASFGPRYLHSTGQLHKGGPPGGAYLIVVDGERAEDASVPGRGFTFGRLIDAQALGDLRSLRARGRRAARIPLRALASLA